MSFKPEEIDDIIRVKNDISLWVFDLNQWLHIVGIRIRLEDCFISGGAIGSLIRGEAVNDYDIYFKHHNNCEDFYNIIKDNFNVYRDYIKDLKSTDMYGDNADVGIDGKHITKNSITFNDGASFIHYISGDPDFVRASFDFQHCKPYYDIEKSKLIISPDQYRLNKQKVLAVNNVENQKDYRIKKFTDRGWVKPHVIKFTDQNLDIQTDVISVITENVIFE